MGKIDFTLYYKALSISMIFRFNFVYFCYTLVLLGIEIVIGAYFHDPVIRPYGGDFLVVILLYCLIRSFCNTPVLATATGVLLVSYVVETLQYFHYADRLGFSKPSLARTLLGTSFSWTDIGSYTLGIGLVLLIEFYVRTRKIHC
jgi:hypothetical protein